MRRVAPDGAALLEERLEQRHLARADELDELPRQLVTVLLDEALDEIAHGSCIVMHDEAVALRTRHDLEFGVALVLLRQLLKQLGIRSVRDEHLLVHERENARRLRRHECHHGRVVSEGELGAGDALRLAFGLLEPEDVPACNEGGTQGDYQNAIRMPSECNQQEGPPRGKDVLVEVCLKSLIGKVDEQLFERVGLKGLEPKYVEHADGTLRVSCIRIGSHGCIDAPDGPEEELAVECACERVAGRRRLGGRLRYLHDGELADALDRQRLLEGRRVEAEELSGSCKARFCSGAHGAAVILLGHVDGVEGQVADVQHRCEHGLQSSLVLSIDREHVHRLARGHPPVGKWRWRRGEHSHADPQH